MARKISQIPAKNIERPSRNEAEEAVHTLLRWAGEDPSREGLAETPKRVALAYEDWFSGYREDPVKYLERTFEEVNGYDEMIVLKDITNSCLGGQLLSDNNIGRRGREKLVRWMAHVDTYGLPAEYNSPNYAAVAVRVLGRLAELTEDQHTRIRARTMLARLGLSAALHIHPGIGCWAGPFSRAYSLAVFNADAFNADDVRAWVGGGQLPAWIGDLLQRPDVPQQIDETAHGEGPVELSTYHSPSFCLGVASRKGAP